MNEKFKRFIPTIAVCLGILMCITDITLDINRARGAEITMVSTLIFCCFVIALVVLYVTMRRYRESEEKFQSIFEQTPNGILLIDQRGAIVEWNCAQEEITGVPRTEAIGAYVWDISFRFQPPEQCSARKKENFRKGFMNVLAKGDVPAIFRRFEDTIVVDGKTKTVLCTVFPVKNGRTLLLGGIMSDISRQKKTAREREEYQLRLRSLSSELTLVEERERRRVAMYLHDSLGQSLALAKMKLGEIRAAAATQGKTTPCEEVGKLIDECIQSTRSLTFELSPPVLYEFGFYAAVEWLAEEIEKHNNIVCTVASTGSDALLSPELKVLLFRAVRELLLNVVKHAGARAVKISLDDRRTSMEVCVEDDGRGFCGDIPAAPKDRRGGFGLFTIREQLASIGGLFTVHSSPGGGTRICITIPVDRREAHEHKNSPC